MNKDQVAGRIEEAKGKLKKVAGKVVGSDELKAEGVMEQATGTLQKTYGDAKEKVKDVSRKAQDRA